MQGAMVPLLGVAVLVSQPKLNSPCWARIKLLGLCAFKLSETKHSTLTASGFGLLGLFSG